MAAEAVDILREASAPDVALFRVASRDGRLDTLLRLRWVALLGQIATLAVVTFGWGAPLDIDLMAVPLAALAISNAILWRRRPSNPEQWSGPVLLVDIGLLTILLALSGGPANPWSALYLVQVMVAAIVATRTWTWLAVLASSCGFGLLFFMSSPLPTELGGHHVAGHLRPYSIHLQGMWFAHVVSAAAIALFVSRLSDSLALERRRRADSSRLLGLTALAAGAAHEIGNPLGTIRIAAGELREELQAHDHFSQFVADVDLINSEVTRAKSVLDRMAQAAGELRGETLRSMKPQELLLECIRNEESRGDHAPVSLQVAEPVPEVRWPKQATYQALCQLIRNAMWASGPQQPVSVSVAADDSGVVMKIQDKGHGMSPEVLARATEPFFTTRPETGTGLGLFVARALVARMGGEMQLSSRPGYGTTVVVRLPTEVSAG